MRPRFLRTPIYHTILSGYLADAKQRDFHSVHIWACPPTRGADYIFHRHPKGQRTPGWERLRLWYNKMLVRAYEENTVIDTGTLYDDHFVLPFSKQFRRDTPPPYFPRHHWLKQLGLIEVANEKRQLRAIASSKTRGKKTTTTSSKRKSRGSRQSLQSKRQRAANNMMDDNNMSTNSSGIVVDVILPSSLTSELSKRLQPMTERLLVVRLQPLCMSCGEYVDSSQKNAWQCVGKCCNRGESESKRTGVKKIDRPSVHLWGSHSTERLVTARNLIRAPAFFCDKCVCGGKISRLAKKTGSKIAQRFGHGPVKRWRRGHEVTDMLNRSRNEEPVNSAIFNKRGSFLSFCCGNHLQFDTLRRAKYSSMIILNLLNRCVEGRIEKSCDQVFIRYCNYCRLPIVSSSCRWYCSTCPDFDVCNKCKVNRKVSNSHPHVLKRAPVMRSGVFQWAVLKEPEIVRNKKFKNTSSASKGKKKLKKEGVSTTTVVVKKSYKYRPSSRPVYSAVAR